MRILIVMMYIFCIAALVLAGYMMSIHQKGPGWVILGAMLIAGSVTYTNEKK